MKRSRPNPQDPSTSQSEVSASATPSPEAIAKRAHELYLARGGAHGCDLDDWLQAEQDLRRAPTSQANPD